MCVYTSGVYAPLTNGRTVTISLEGALCVLYCVHMYPSFRNAQIRMYSLSIMFPSKCFMYQITAVEMANFIINYFVLIM